MSFAHFSSGFFEKLFIVAIKGSNVKKGEVIDKFANAYIVSRRNGLNSFARR